MNLDPSEIRFGAADANSGLDLSTLSVEADFVVEGRPPGAELSDLFVVESPGVFVLSLGEPLPGMAEAHVFVEVKDVQGNVTRVDRRFAVGETIFSDGFESGDTSAWSATVGGG